MVFQVVNSSPSYCIILGFFFFLSFFFPRCQSTVFFACHLSVGKRILCSILFLPVVYQTERPSKSDA
ncbi:hypothetical protein BDV34DRAFT_177435 [Aspergillus parasiticus]|uniref:Uncharacterized protein n=1 Tax=Aspergillus parasiticus TaxID=5067 RepID=A0A5N6D8C0_ASPPA|nr:hypothetical protein BDV34DRAFT_177435 [Aspergillus parasiticus]